MKTLCILLLAVSAFGQDAKVAQLTPQQAEQAKQLYEAKKKADAAWETFKASIDKAYGPDLKAQSVKFSDDFKFVVPDGFSFSSSSGSLVLNSPWVVGGCLVTNADGTGATWGGCK